MDDAGAVAQQDELQLARRAPVIDPAAQFHFLAGLGGDVGDVGLGHGDLDKIFLVFGDVAFEFFCPIKSGIDAYIWQL